MHGELAALTAPRPAARSNPETRLSPAEHDRGFVCPSLRRPPASQMRWGPVTRASPRPEQRSQGRGRAWLSELQRGRQWLPLGRPVWDLGGGRNRLPLFNSSHYPPGACLLQGAGTGAAEQAGSLCSACGSAGRRGQVACVMAQHPGLSSVCLSGVTAWSLFLGSSRGWGESHGGPGARMEKLTGPGACPSSPAFPGEAFHLGGFTSFAINQTEPSTRFVYRAGSQTTPTNDWQPLWIPGRFSWLKMPRPWKL